MYSVRKARENDFEAIKSLYRKVAEHTIGIARSKNEISDTYIHNFINSALVNGIELVVENPEAPQELIAEIHCYKLIPSVFDHILSELTIVVDPDFHSRGLGRLIFTALLEYVKNNRTDILRVELVTRESNLKAINFYKSLGFLQEGRMEYRIKSPGGGFEADIPMAWFNKNFERIN